MHKNNHFSGQIGLAQAAVVMVGAHTDTNDMAILDCTFLDCTNKPLIHILAVDNVHLLNFTAVSQYTLVPKPSSHFLSLVACRLSENSEGVVIHTAQEQER